jgi:hypothetical protein
MVPLSGSIFRHGIGSALQADGVNNELSCGFALQWM